MRSLYVQVKKNCSTSSRTIQPIAQITTPKKLFTFLNFSLSPFFNLPPKANRKTDVMCVWVYFRYRGVLSWCMLWRLPLFLLIGSCWSSDSTGYVSAMGRKSTGDRPLLPIPFLKLSELSETSCRTIKVFNLKRIFWGFNIWLRRDLKGGFVGHTCRNWSLEDSYQHGYLLKIGSRKRQDYSYRMIFWFGCADSMSFWNQHSKEYTRWHF